MSTDMRIQGCLKKASTKSTTIEKAQASSLGTSKLLLVVEDLHVVEGTWDLHVEVVGIRGLLLLDASRLIAGTECIENKGGNKSKGEYLAYSARLKPKHSMNYAFVSKWKERLYSGLHDRSTTVRGKT